MKLKHIVEFTSYNHSTERTEVFAYCGYDEEASGSGKHEVDQGDADCEKCKKYYEDQMKIESYHY